MNTTITQIGMLLCAILLFSVASVATSAPEDTGTASNKVAEDTNIALGFGVHADHGFYTSTNDELSSLGLLSSLYLTAGLSKIYKEQHELSAYLGYQLTALESYYGDSRADANRPDGATGYLNGVGVEGYYTFRPYKYLTAGGFATLYASTGQDCSEESRTSCSVAKANKIDIGLTLGTNIGESFNPYMYVGYSQMNFRLKPYESTRMGIGIKGRITNTRLFGADAG